MHGRRRQRQGLRRHHRRRWTSPARAFPASSAPTSSRSTPSAYTATFADKNVGTAKAVTVRGVALSGADAGNYTVAQPTGLTADITALDITGAFTADNKPFDGTTDATVATRSLVGTTVR